MLPRSCHPAIGRSLTSLSKRSSSFSSSSSATITATTTPTTPTTPSTKGIYKPRPIPESPLQDPNRYVKYSHRHPKSPRPASTSIFLPLEQKLERNPYAHILAQPIRQEVEFQCRVPRSFLIRFRPLVHPETTETWIVPDGLRRKDKSHVGRSRPGRWAMCNVTVLRAMKKSLKRLSGSVHNAVCPKNMVECVGDLIRQRVLEEISAARGEVCVPMGKDWETEGAEGKEVGCVLDWGLEEGAEGVLGEDIDEKVAKGEKVEREKVLIEVSGRLCPLHHMRVILGEQLAEKIRKLWMLEAGITRVGLLRNQETLQIEIWLMKLRSYMGIW